MRQRRCRRFSEDLAQCSCGRQGTFRKDCAFFGTIRPGPCPVREQSGRIWRATFQRPDRCTSGRSSPEAHARVAAASFEVLEHPLASIGPSRSRPAGVPLLGVTVDSLRDAMARRFYDLVTHRLGIERRQFRCQDTRRMSLIGSVISDFLVIDAPSKARWPAGRRGGQRSPAGALSRDSRNLPTTMAAG
jgi:hypothetical protein